MPGVRGARGLLSCHPKWYLVFSPPGNNEVKDTVILYSLESGEEIKRVGLQSVLTYGDVGSARLVGDRAFIPDRDGTLTEVRFMTLHTGEVRSVRTELNERLRNAHVSADEGRVVVCRPCRSSVDPFLGFVVYTVSTVSHMLRTCCCSEYSRKRRGCLLYTSPSPRD